MHGIDPAGHIAEEDVDEILNRMALELTKVPKTEERARCCRTSYGFRSIHSIEEFMNAITNCKVVFVLVTTTYCPYCRMFKPIFAKVAEEFRGSAAFIEANADYVPEVAMGFGVYSTPTTVVVIDGRAVDALLGYMPYQYFRSYVEEVLKSARCGEN
ncbi:MAG: thioredoxin family protein [Ignisphaera sp.]